MRTLLVLVCGVVLSVGCTPDAGVDAGTTPDAGGGLDAGGAEDAGGGVDAAPGLPGVPVLLDVSLVEHGTFALSWRLPDSGCDQLVIMRNQDGGAFSMAQRLTGVATEIQDSPGHTDGTYCYTVSCELGGVTSDPSNERCGTQ